MNGDGQNPYKQSGLYSHAPQEYHQNGYSKESLNDSRNDYMKSESHKRQSGVFHGNFNHSKGHSLGESTPRRSPRDERMYATAPDLPPRVDRGVKPPGMHATPTKSLNG